MILYDTLWYGAVKCEKSMSTVVEARKHGAYSAQSRITRSDTLTVKQNETKRNETKRGELNIGNLANIQHNGQLRPERFRIGFRNLLSEC